MGADNSILVGSKSHIDRARHFRKMFGGGWRQTGGIAAQADWAVTYHFPRLAGTHALARRLADRLKAIGCEILAPVDTNMVFFDAGPLGLSFETVKKALAELDKPIRLGSNRCVVHHQTSPESIDDFVDEVRRLAEAVRPSESAAYTKKAAMGYR